MRSSGVGSMIDPVVWAADALQAVVFAAAAAVVWRAAGGRRRPRPSVGLRLMAAGLALMAGVGIANLTDHVVVGVGSGDLAAGVWHGHLLGPGLEIRRFGLLGAVAVALGLMLLGAVRWAAETRADRALLNRVLETAVSAIVTLDRTGRITYANPAAERLFALDRPRILDRSYNDPAWRITDLDGRPIADEDLPFRRVAAAGRALSGTTLAIARPDGSRRLLSTNGAPMVDRHGRFDGAVFGVEDVTERLEANAALRRSERRLTHGEALAHLGSWTWERGEDRFQVSAEWQRMHGVVAGCLSRAAWLDCAHPDDRSALAEAFEAATRDGRPFALEHRIVRACDGVERRVRALGQAEGSGPRPDRLFGAALDVTEARRLSDALAIAKAEAEAASRAKSSFLAAMSHELRTPLTSILGFSEMLAHRREAAEPETVRRYAEMIFESGEHLLSLINDMLDIAKIEAGRMEIAPEWIDVARLLRAVAGLQQERAARAGLILGVTGPPADTPYLWADERAARQILFNLLSNAIRFTRPGGRVSLSASPIGDGGVALVVSDTGIGIPADQLTRVTKPFEQMDNRYGIATGGTGLGLSLVRGLIGVHGGAFAIASTVGVGTSVTVSFPPGPMPPPGSDRTAGPATRLAPAPVER